MNENEREREIEREVREDQQRRKDYFLPLESEAEGRVAKLDKSGQKTDKKLIFIQTFFLSLSFFLSLLFFLLVFSLFSFFWLSGPEEGEKDCSDEKAKNKKNQARAKVVYDQLQLNQLTFGFDLLGVFSYFSYS